MRLNDNRTSYFGYKAIQLFKNNSKNKQSIFKDWEKLKHNITFIHPQ
ncbi:isochorismate synthase, partial [Staphylococcus aureus]